MEKSTYYYVLDISTNATPDEIHDGYIRAKNTYSPDSVAMYSLLTESECIEMLDQIETAYSVLSVPNKRLEYDRVQNINNSYNQPLNQTPKNSSNQNNNNESIKNSSKSSKDSYKIIQHDVKISKISAQGRFSLVYERNENFEQEIDNTQKFTGDILRKIREYKNVNVDRMADLIRVSKTYIRQIEGDQFDKLPALAYVRGFIYQYAKCLKLDPNLVANSYVEHIKENREKLKKTGL